MAAHRKTRQTFDTPGDAHFLTFSCFKRLPLLNRDRSRTWFIEAMRKAAGHGKLDLWAYVIMPEHVHLVLLPAPNVRVAEILSMVKQSTAKRALLWTRQNAPDFLPNLCDQQPNGKTHHRFWQRGGGYDRNLRSVRDIHEKIAYVHVTCPQ